MRILKNFSKKYTIETGLALFLVLSAIGFFVWGMIAGNMPWLYSKGFPVLVFVIGVWQFFRQMKHDNELQ